MKGPNADRSKRVLDVLVNGEYQFFDNGPLRRRDFTGFYSSFYINDTLTSILKYEFKSGIVVVLRCLSSF